MSKDWTEDFEYENGMYQNRCITCNEVFIGYFRNGKRSYTGKLLHDVKEQVKLLR